MTGRDWITGLPAELAGQKAIMLRLLDVCERDDRIRWLAIGCSLGRGAADSLSDLDMALGVRDADFDAAITDIRAAAGELGDLVDSFHHLLPGVPEPHERIFAQYADRCQLDLVVFTASTDIGRGPSIVVLYDPGNTIEVRADRPSVTTGQVREWAFQAWAALADVGKYLRRASPWEALARLHEARNLWWQLWAVAHDVPDARYGIVSLLDFAPDQVPAELAATVPNLSIGQLAPAAQRLAGALAAIGTSLPDEYRAVLPDAMARYITADLSALTSQDQVPAADDQNESWAPTDCTLPTVERPLRAAAFGSLFGDAVLTVERTETGLLRLGLRPGADTASRTAAVTAAETECCSFFTFTLTAGNDSLHLDIAVPDSRTDILDALERQARAAVAGG
jgi:hypothetical protein